MRRLLVVLLLCFPGVSFAANRDALMHRAQQLGWNKEYIPAKTIYRHLLQKNPHDWEAQLGLATVLAWEGNHAAAEMMYRAIVAHDSKFRDAVLGLGRVLLWQGRHDESLATFDRWLATHPNDAEAVAERTKVVAAMTAPVSSASASPERPFFVRAGYQLYDMNFTTTAHAADLLVAYTRPKKWGARVGFQYLDKFDDAAPSYKGGGTYWATPTTVLALDAEFSPGHTVVPHQAYTFEISQTIFKKLVPSLAYRFANYATANSHTVMSGVTWYFAPRWDWLFRYFLTVSQLGGKNSVNHSGMTRLAWNPVNPLRLSVGYSRSNESFESGNPVTPVGNFGANHFNGGFRWEVSKGIGLDCTADHERRNNGGVVTVYNVGISRRW